MGNFLECIKKTKAQPNLHSTKTLEQREQEIEVWKDHKRILMQLDILQNEYADLLIRVNELERRR